MTPGCAHLWEGDRSWVSPNAMDVFQLCSHLSFAVKDICCVHAAVLCIPELRHLVSCSSVSWLLPGWSGWTVPAQSVLPVSRALPWKGHEMRPWQLWQRLLEAFWHFLFLNQKIPLSFNITPQIFGKKYYSCYFKRPYFFCLLPLKNIKWFLVHFKM